MSAHDAHADPLHEIFDLLKLEELLPDSYAAHRPLLRDAVLFFLDRLPDGRRAEILAAQENLPRATPPEGRFLAILHCCPTLHKLGQVVARDRRLAPELRRSLQALECMAPRLSPEETSRLLAREAPHVEVPELLSPLAEASVAVVIPYESRIGSGEATQGILKVLKPGVEERLADDLAVWSELAAFLEERSRRYGLAAVDYGETLEQVQQLLIREVDPSLEQRHLAAAASFFGDLAHVEVPRLLPECGPRITAMTRVQGGKVTAIQGSASRRRAARVIVDALVARPLFSTQEPILFHGDPHAGNLLWTDDDKLGLLDWSLMGRLSQSVLVEVVRMLLAALRLDNRGILRSLEGLAVNQPDERALADTVHRSLRRLREGALPGVGWLMGLLDETAFYAAARYEPDLLLFRKSLLTLDGVVRDLAPHYPVGLELALQGVRRLAAEWPTRALAWPTSRQFATHVSNLDLLALLWSGPLATRNWWRLALADLQQAVRPASQPPLR